MYIKTNRDDISIQRKRVRRQTIKRIRMTEHLFGLDILVIMTTFPLLLFNLHSIVEQIG
jgi:hypothetical protein